MAKVPTARPKDVAREGLSIQEHISNAIEIADKGRNGTLSEDVSLLCADTRLMFAQQEIETLRRHLKWRREDIAKEREASSARVQRA